MAARTPLIVGRSAGAVTCDGVAPDLIVLFGDLYWRAVGTVGGDEGVHTFENDTGPDDANHAHDGIFVLSSTDAAVGPVEDRSLLDVAPTLQTLLRLSAPAGQSGQSLV